MSKLQDGVFTFPILQGEKFIVRGKRIVHLESNCCIGHGEKCKCGFCQLHKPYIESAAYKLYNFNVDLRNKESVSQ